MTGTPRSYALDRDVVDFLDSQPDGRKRPNQFSKRHYASSRSKMVSRAVRAYYLTETMDRIQEQRDKLQAELLKATEHSCLWCRFRSRLKR